MAALRLNLLGGFELLSGSGAPLCLPPRKAKALLAYLALGGARPHARDKLAALLWTDSDDAQARTSLRQALTAIRKALGAEDCIVADMQAIALNLEALAVDVLGFEALATERNEAALTRAVGLYTGDLLEGFRVEAPGFEAWLGAEQARVRGIAIDALSRLAEAHAARGRIEPAIATASRLVALDPLLEGAHRVLMALFLKQGRQAAALRQYRTCREILRRELGVSPEPETERLHREILRLRREDDGTESALPAAAPADEESPAVQPGEANTQLREAVVLAVEIAESAWQADAELVHEILTRFHARGEAIVRQYGGSVASRIGGRLVAVFGAPTAHGNDAERGVRAALALCGGETGAAGAVAMPLKVRAGIASGPVLAEQRGGALFVSGKPLGLATCIMEGGAWSEVRISARVRDALAERVEAQRLPDLSCEPMALPTRVWRVGRCDGAAYASSIPLVGRRVPLQQLEGLAAACVAEQRGHVVLIRGEAGIGKSRLIQAFESRSPARGQRCQKALVFDVAAEGDVDPLSQLLRSMLGLDATQPPDALEAIIDRVGAEAGLDEQERIVLRPILGVPQPAALARLLEAMDHEVRQRAEQRLLCSAARWASGRAPLGIIVEDIHWATRETLAQLAALAASARACPLLLVLSMREGADPIDAAWRAAARGADFTAIDLAPLDEAEARELAAHYPCADAARVRSCIERAQGNPLFLDQLLRSADAGHGPLPGSVQSIVLARMDRLAAVDREVLQAASILGQQFSLSALRQLAPGADEACARLVEQALIRPEGAGFLFVHALVQEGVYASLLKSRRRELHGRAARWYADHDPVLHAEHLEQAGDVGAAQAYVDAAHAQLRRYHHERALRLADRGVALALDAALKFEATAMRARLLLEIGRVSDATEAFHAAVSLSTGGAQTRRALTGLAAALRVCDRHREALDALDEALAVEGDEASAGELAEIHLLRGNLYFPLGDRDACLAEHERARDYAARAASPQLEARALSGLGDAYYQRAQMLTAHRYFDRCIVLCEQHEIPGVQAVNLTMRAATRLNRIELAGALEDARRASDLAARIGDLRAQMLAESMWATGLAYATDWRGVVEHAELALEIARRLGARRFEAEIVMYLGLAYGQLGERERGERILDACHAICVETGASAYIGPPVLAACATVTADARKRRSALAEGEALLAAGCVSHCHLLFYEYAIDLQLEQGNRDEVLRYAAALEAYARVEPTPWSEFLVRRARALAQAGEGRGDATLAETLRNLAELARHAGMKWRLGKIEDALRRLPSAG